MVHRKERLPMSWVEKLIKEYAGETKHLEKYRSSLDTRDSLAAEEAETVSGMISDMRYALEWMRRGRRPGNRRGADIKDVYRQRELFTELQPLKLTANAQRDLALSLLELSTRERTCFLLHMAHGLTYSEIGDRLNVSKASVQKFVSRARSKVQQGITG
jgi:RNA polymerase sigma factor (sigma-70 family)